MIVVDNGSTDGSIDFVKKLFPEVNVLALGDNLGFAAAVNGRTARSAATKKTNDRAAQVRPRGGVRVIRPGRSR